MMKEKGKKTEKERERGRRSGYNYIRPPPYVNPLAFLFTTSLVLSKSDPRLRHGALANVQIDA